MRIRQPPIGLAAVLQIVGSAVLASTGTDGIQTILQADDLVRVQYHCLSS